MINIVRMTTLKCISKESKAGVVTVVPPVSLNMIKRFIHFDSDYYRRDNDTSSNTPTVESRSSPKCAN